MQKLGNQQIFELQKSILNRWKGLEKFYSMVKCSKTVTETITIENPKTLELTLECDMSMKNFI